MDTIRRQAKFETLKIGENSLPVLAVAVALMLAASVFAADSWRRLTIPPEDWCSPYDRADYHYPGSVEARVGRPWVGASTAPTPGEHSPASGTGGPYDGGYCSTQASSASSD